MKIYFAVFQRMFLFPKVYHHAKKPYKIDVFLKVASKRNFCKCFK